MITISDSRPDASDVSQYLTQLKNRRGGSSDVLSKKEATSMRKKQDSLITNYVYTNEDVQKTIDVSKKLKKKINNIGAEKTRVSIAVQAARTALDDAKQQKFELETKLLEVDALDEEKEINDELAYVNGRIVDLEQDFEKKVEDQKKVLNAESYRIQQLKNNEKNRGWAKVNQRAIAANKAADVEAYKMRQTEEEEKDNPFARRKVKPTILWTVGQEKKEDDRGAVYESGESKVDHEVDATTIDENIETGDANLSSSRDLRSGLKKKLSEHINDMSIDDEDIPRLMMSNTTKTFTSRVRRGISLSEYFERKSAGTL